MTPIGTLLLEIWQKDRSFYIFQPAYSTNVRMENIPDENHPLVCVETESLGRTVEKLWAMLYNAAKE